MGPFLRHWAQAAQLLSKKCLSGGEPFSTLSDLTGPRFEPQTSRPRDERVTARPTNRFNDKCSWKSKLLQIGPMQLFYILSLRKFFEASTIQHFLEY